MGRDLVTSLAIASFLIFPASYVLQDWAWKSCILYIKKQGHNLALAPIFA